MCHCLGFEPFVQVQDVGQSFGPSFELLALFCESYVEKELPR